MSQSLASRRIIAAVIAMFLVWLLASPVIHAHADVGLPPVNPGGSSLSPQETIQTHVRMVMEEVNLTVEPYERPIPAHTSDNPGFWMRVLVDGKFVMRNMGDAPETFDVWFPLAATTRYPDLLMYLTNSQPENIIQDFQVWVDGLPIDTRQVSGPALNLPEGESPWATFPVSFPARQDVVIRVSYTLYPGGWRPFGDVEYILQTGAGWVDTIGEATITVYLPDNITQESVSLGGNSIFGGPLEPQPAGYVVENNLITWHFNDLEPGPKDDIFLNVLEPQRYRRLLQARGKAAQADPANTAETAAAYLELARAAQEAVMIIKTVAHNGGGLALGDEATAAFARALELNPDQASIYSEYARWLMIVTRGWMQLETQGTCPQEVCDLVQRGLEKFPQDAELQKLDIRFKDSLRMHHTEVAIATQDAMATQNAMATITRQTTMTQMALPTKTPKPSNTYIPASPTAQPTVLPTPAPTGVGSLCPAGLISIIVVGMFASMTAYRRRI